MTMMRAHYAGLAFGLIAGLSAPAMADDAGMAQTLQGCWVQSKSDTLVHDELNLFIEADGDTVTAAVPSRERVYNGTVDDTGKLVLSYTLKGADDLADPSHWSGIDVPSEEVRAQIVKAQPTSRYEIKSVSDDEIAVSHFGFLARWTKSGTLLHIEPKGFEYVWRRSDTLTPSAIAFKSADFSQTTETLTIIDKAAHLEVSAKAGCDLQIETLTVSLAHDNAGSAAKVIELTETAANSNLFRSGPVTLSDGFNRLGTLTATLPTGGPVAQITVEKDAATLAAEKSAAERAAAKKAAAEKAAAEKAAAEKAAAEKAAAEKAAAEKAATEKAAAEKAAAEKAAAEKAAAEKAAAEKAAAEKAAAEEAAAEKAAAEKAAAEKAAAEKAAAEKAAAEKAAAEKAAAEKAAAPEAQPDEPAQSAGEPIQLIPSADNPEPAAPETPSDPEASADPEAPAATEALKDPETLQDEPVSEWINPDAEAAKTEPAPGDQPTADQPEDPAQPEAEAAEPEEPVDEAAEAMNAAYRQAYDGWIANIEQTRQNIIVLEKDVFEADEVDVDGYQEQLAAEKAKLKRLNKNLKADLKEAAAAFKESGRDVPQWIEDAQN